MISALGAFFPHRALLHIHTWYFSKAFFPKRNSTTPTFLSNHLFPGTAFSAPGNFFNFETKRAFPAVFNRIV
jgi:hypothetical protein